jgi:hypothetical protein
MQCFAAVTGNDTYEKQNNDYTETYYSIQTYGEKLGRPQKLLHEIVRIHVVIYLTC